MTINGLVLRFLFGGATVAASAVIGRKLGGKIGGIFAAFPAVFASAVISTTFGLPQSKAIHQTLSLSKGALIGMIADVACAIAAGWLISRFGWKKGLILALIGWLLLSSVVYVAGVVLGWFK